jgi:hypothetical protein
LPSAQWPTGDSNLAYASSIPIKRSVDWRDVK